MGRGKTFRRKAFRRHAEDDDSPSRERPSARRQQERPTDQRLPTCFGSNFALFFKQQAHGCASASNRHIDAMRRRSLRKFGPGDINGLKALKFNGRKASTWMATIKFDPRGIKFGPRRTKGPHQRPHAHEFADGNDDDGGGPGAGPGDSPGDDHLAQQARRTNSEATTREEDHSRESAGE